MSSVYTFKSFLFYFFLIFCFSQKITAQVNPYLSVTFKDSLLADEKSTFLYNHATIVNTFNQLISFTCIIETPPGWNLLSQNNIYVELAAGQSYPLNITLNRQKFAEANWKKVSLKLNLKNDRDTNYYAFFIKTNPIKTFRARAVVREIILESNAQEAILPVRIINVGNVKQTFSLQYNNQKLGINSNISLTLEPGKDSIFNYRLKLSARLKKLIVKEEVYLTVTGDKDKIGLYSFILTNMASYRKIHSSAFETFPLNIETGIININKKYSGYFALEGAYKIKNDNKFLFNYHSKQFGIDGLQQNIFNIGYNSKKWSLYAGQISEVGPFLNFGNGIKIMYTKSEDEGFSIFANKSTQTFFKGSNMGGSIKLKIKKIIFFDEAMANFDKIKNRNSFIITNKTTFVNNKKILLAVNAGYGFAYNTSQAKFNNQNTFGYSYGYNFKNVVSKKISLQSSVQFNSNAFPGNYQGYRQQTHSTKWQPNKKVYFSINYNLNYFKKSFFRDSIFYRSLLLSNNKQISFNTGVMLFKKIAIDVGSGYMKNAVAEAENPPTFKFGSLGLNFQLFRAINFSGNGIVGVSDGFNSFNQKVYQYSLSAGMSFAYGGVQVLYDQIPYFALKNNEQFFNGYQNLLNYGPYISKSFFRHALEVRGQYNYSKRVPDNFSIENGTISISYLNQKIGLNIQISGSSSINTATPYKFGMFTLRKNIQVSKPYSRKYFDVKLNIFNDENNDGIKNNDEKALRNLEILLNEQPYVSNKKGTVFIDNTDPGKYEIDFHTIKGTDGLIPANGFKQKIELQKNLIINIPFKKGKIISGSIIVVRDSFSTQNFLPDRLKITVTDSKGEKYTTITNSKGQFNIGVPNGKYLVSLNPLAFDDVFKPVQMAFTVDLINNVNEKVIFVIKQKQRKVVMVKSNLKSL